MESFISPLGQELAETDTLSPPARQALAEIFQGTALGERVVSYKIWMPDGLVVHASDKGLIGTTFEPSENLRSAWNGQIASSFEDLNDLEDEAEAALGIPLLEVYSPIHQIWTGEIIAVAEFYERADGLAAELHSARLTSWLVVGGAFLASGLLVFGIVQAGGRTIRQQREALEQQLAQTEKVSRQNVELRERAVQASSRATAQTERAIRRVGFDLHDGPAQYLALAALRLDSVLDKGDAADVTKVRGSLNKALEELRIISRGLALPDLDETGIFALAERAVQDHKKQTGMTVHLVLPEGQEPDLGYTQKLCAFRFLQETLSNASRHAEVNEARVSVAHSDNSVQFLVSDQGKGFDPATTRKVREDGGQGLFGLLDRAESIGGEVSFKSNKSTGTTIILTLPYKEKRK
ncbi:MAG: two-component sensor histidine kinase [Rhodobacteraceae bacterium]|nr:two-component sensor histidine kinase [Paracoccaceae bacterium]